MFVNNYLYNETSAMTFLGMGKAGERREGRVPSGMQSNPGLFWINAPTCLERST